MAFLATSEDLIIRLMDKGRLEWQRSLMVLQNAIFEYIGISSYLEYFVASSIFLFTVLAHITKVFHFSLHSTVRWILSYVAG